MNNSQEQYLIDCWQSLINYIRDHGQVDVSLIESFYEPAYIHSFTNDKVIIITENTVAKQIMSSQSDVIKNAFIDLFDTGLNFTVTIYQVSELKIAPELTGKKVSEKHVAQFPSMPLQSDKTFENFIVGDCNRESKAAALACAVGPGQFYNPLFIFGNSGLGKTHLLMAIANYVLANDPGKKVYYTESLKFVETVVSCIQNNTIDDFKQYMYNVDVLIVDDIQFLAGKEKSHEVFFTIYNELVSHKKQICLASDRQPREIKGLEERLITRFSSGLSVGIDSPEFETSLAILRTKIKSNGSGSGMGIGDIEDEGLNYIASNFSGNVRDLEGAWNRVLFYAIQFQQDGGVIGFIFPGGHGLDLHAGQVLLLDDGDQSCLSCHIYALEKNLVEEITRPSCPHVQKSKNQSRRTLPSRLLWTKLPPNLANGREFSTIWYLKQEISTFFPT